jgi:hypothetical protein
MSVEAMKQSVEALKHQKLGFAVVTAREILEKAIAEAEKQEQGEPIGTFKRQHWISGSPGVVILHKEKEQDMHDGENVYTRPYTRQPKQEPLTDGEIWEFWWNKPEVPEGEDDSMEAQFVTAVRAVLAAHGIK